jgi:methyltransferase (TIGR00027 family)
MRLPNLSYMVTVGQLRHIQSRYEPGDRRNPDTAVAQLLSASQRLGCAIRGRFLLPRLRARGFYQYLLARTRYYDEVFIDAAEGGFGRIINIGCGSDTRAYRFEGALRRSGVEVIECDLPQAIRVKQRTAQARWRTDHIRYLPLDLNEPGWTPLEEVLDQLEAKPVLVMMEGVSAYVDREAFQSFLRFLALRLPPGSGLAYDCKVAGVNDGFGSSERVRGPFRLPAGREHILAFHEGRGFDLQHMELSADLQERLAPGSRPAFNEDCVMRFTRAAKFVVLNVPEGAGEDTAAAARGKGSEGHAP